MENNLVNVTKKTVVTKYKNGGVLSAIALILAAVSVSPVVGLSNDVFADEVETKADVASSLPESKLFSDVVGNNGLQKNVSVSYEGTNKISKVVDSDNKVLVAEVSNFVTSETVAVTRTDKEIIVEKIVKGYNGENEVTRESYPLAMMDQNFEGRIAPRSSYSAWRYTNFAVGIHAFSTLTNFGVSALVIFVARIFSIATVAAGCCLITWMHKARLWVLRGYKWKWLDWFVCSRCME
ncbi:MAG: hypothetical protein H9W81_11690 [Enterococcus sp.]|nr:hypothetical protein [Enterococcus sp.]